MTGRLEPEFAATRNVQRALKAEFARLNDVDNRPGQHDAELVVQGRRIALEVTSFGGVDWRRTGDAIAKARSKLAGASLRHQWGVVVDTRMTRINELAPVLEPTLAALEAASIHRLTIPRRRCDDDFEAAIAPFAEQLAALNVHQVYVCHESPPPHQPHILVQQSETIVGTAGALAGALWTVLHEKRDNQAKLRRADCDERHLYVFVEDLAAGAVLGAEPAFLPACPKDPDGVVDVVWVYGRSNSAILFRTAPGSEHWQRYWAATGDLARTVEE